MQKLFPWTAAIVIACLVFPSAPLAGEVAPGYYSRRVPAAPIMLEGPASLSEAELSDMAWQGDRLLLLPQYPGRFAEKGQASLFSIPKARILAYLDGTSPGPIRPDRVPLDMDGVEQAVEEAAGKRSFQGFEAIVFWGDCFFLSIESEKSGRMHAFLAGGTVQGNGSAMALDRRTLVSVPMPVQTPNKAYEAVFIVENRLIAIYEANGVQNNPRPRAQAFALRRPPEKAAYLGEIPFPSMEYRITGVTAWDKARPLTAVNYYFPGDRNALPPFSGPGKAVERLVSLSFDGKAIALRQAAFLDLTDDDPQAPRNWEGIARLDDRGFLVVTDKWPKTILAFVPDPQKGKAGED